MKPLGRCGSQAGGSAPWAADRSSEAHFSVEADGAGAVSLPTLLSVRLED